MMKVYFRGSVSAVVGVCLWLSASAVAAQDFDRDAYREVATECVEHLRNSRTALDAGDRDTALSHLQNANDPCTAARDHLVPAIEAATLPRRELETLRTDYVGQDASFITIAAQLGLCNDAQSWLTAMARLIPEIPERVQSRYIQATQAVLVCEPSELQTDSSEINVMGTPSFGTFNVVTNFQPDPQTYTIVAGGTVDSSVLQTPNGACNAGWVATVPDIRINYTTGSYPLRFYVDTPGTDTTLAVNTPDGTWHCNDDTVGLQPVIDIAAPAGGQYDIFVGTYAQNENPSITLYVTEIPTNGPVGQATDTPVGAIDWTGAPTFGAHAVISGFQPDPTSYAITAGGTVQSSATLTTAAGTCYAGWVATTPDIRITYTSGSYPLRFYVNAPNTDTTMAIHGPDGQWYCNDDGVGLHPVLDFAQPMSGQYDVFVGTYAQNVYPDVSLFVTEMPTTYGPTP